MGLVTKQARFTNMVALLLHYATSKEGWEITLGDAYRDKRCSYGHPGSLHRSRLAIDLNLFIEGRYITTNEGHSELHKFWESIGGSRIIKSDPNHYSLSHGGMI